jgi:hypothetical protein
MTKIISTKIKNIKIMNDKLIIETYDGDYYSDIIKGSISFKILNLNNKILSLSYLENEDLIQIKAKENKIIKIFINEKYDFVSDSSEEINY